MGELIEIKKVEVINNGTIIQIDTENSKMVKERIFVDTNLILMELNNYLYKRDEEELLSQGFVKKEGSENKVFGELELK